MTFATRKRVLSRQVLRCHWYCHRLHAASLTASELRSSIFGTNRVLGSLGTGKKIIIIYHEQSRLSTEQFEGGSASVGHQTKTGHSL